MTDTGYPRSRTGEQDGLSGHRALSTLDVLEALGKGKTVFLAVLLIGMVMGIAAALIMPKRYSAATIVLPPQSQSASSSALVQLGALAGMAGLGAPAKSPDEMYVSLLKTREVQGAVIDQLGLVARYGVETHDAARARLADKVVVLADKKAGLIHITAEDADPEVAARLANLHVNALRRLLSRLAISEAQQRRQFFEKQLGKAREALANAEQVFRDEQARSGFVIAQALAESGMQASITLRSEIANREIRLSALRAFATQEHPDVKRLLSELAALRAQLQQREGGAGQASPAGASGSKAALAFRDMKVQEAALEAVMRQLEIARLDEAQEAPQLQQIDVATAPELASGPRKLWVVGGAALASLFVGLFAAIAYGLLLDNAASNRERWQAVRRAWGFSARA